MRCRPWASAAWPPAPTPAGRIRAVQWFIRAALTDWNASHYQNLRLAGFYWYQEAIDLGVAGEKTLVRTTARDIHVLGLRFYWIPYFEAPGTRSGSGSVSTWP
jgi:hypothetical protein